MPTRLKMMRELKKDDDFDPEMPDVSAEYLLAYLFEVGPTMLVGMGEGPLTHTELAAWQSNTGVELDPWEARTLLRLSRDYMLESQKSAKLEYPAPFDPTNRMNVAIVAARMRKSISGLRKM